MGERFCSPQFLFVFLFFPLPSHIVCHAIHKDILKDKKKEKKTDENLSQGYYIQLSFSLSKLKKPFW